MSLRPDPARVHLHFANIAVGDFFILRSDAETSVADVYRKTRGEKAAINGGEVNLPPQTEVIRLLISSAS